MSRREVALCTGVVLALLIAGLIRVYPYDATITRENSAGDDWLSYHLNAVSIVEGGLHMPSERGAYWIPGGFLYNYFVAAIYAVAGVKPWIVYIVHHVCLGIGAVLMYIWARRFLSPALAAGYLVVTAAFLLYTFRWWTILLLSENLAIILYPLFLVLLTPAVERRSMRHVAAAGFVAGLLILTRPNLIGWPVLLGVLLLRPDAAWLVRLKSLALYAFSTVAGAAFLPVRNYYVAHRWTAASYGNLLPAGGLLDMMTTIGKRALFCAGVLIGGWELKGPGIIVDKKWLLLVLIAIAAFGYLAVTRTLRWADVAAVLALAAAFGPFALIPALGGYGFRFQYPYGPLLLFIAFRGAQEWMVRHRARALPPVHA